MSDEPRCGYCGAPAPRCAAIRDEPWWLGLHQDRPDVIQLREEQRAWRIAHGHETSSGAGVLREGGEITRGRTTGRDDEADELMLRQIARWRRGY